MYTANTMASAIEALGMSLPYSSSTPAEDPGKLDECFAAGAAIRELSARFTGLDEAVRVKRQLPEGKLLVVPDCGHVVEAERPGIFNPAMMQFFRRTRSPAS